VRCTEWAATSDLDDHIRAADERAHDPDGLPLHDYAQLLAEAASTTVVHELLVTVTVDLRRVRGERHQRVRAEEAGVEALRNELRALTARLEAAGLGASRPLTVAQTAEALRARIDPAARIALRERRRTLAELAGISCYNAGPLATDLGWRAVRCDASWHRTYWVAEWPRFDTGPGWLEPLLLHPGGTRTFAIHYEPVAPSASRRQVDRDATRLATDEEQRSRTGFRIGAEHRRSSTAVVERDSELTAGYSELAYAGFLTVTAPDTETLDRSCAEYEQAAARAGLELRPVDGQHDFGLACTLPVGRGLTGGSV
jgi:hypothetical protein